jgi:hypothetical protein
MEAIGYISRSLSAKKDPYNIIYFVIQYFFIVTAPVFVSASVYVCLNKVIAWAIAAGYNEKENKWLRPRAILWGFVTCDVISTVVQVAGAASIGRAESNRKDPTTPNHILLAGLAFQSFAFLIFLVLLGFFIRSLVKDQAIGAGMGGKRPFIISLVIASLLIFLRILFRLAETAQGVFGYLMEHEVFFGVLEFAPIMVAIWILAIWHPGKWMAPNRSAVRGHGEHKNRMRKDEMTTETVV